MNKRDPRGQSGTSEVFRRQPYLIFGGLNGRYRAADHTSSIRKPKRRVAVRCADLEYPACDCRTNQYSQKLASAAGAYYQALRVNSIVTFPIYLALIALAPEMIVALVGDRWLPAAPIVRLLSILGITQTMQLLAVPIINAMGKPVWGMGIAAASALLVVGGCLLAIPYGITAVAGAVALRGLLVLPLLLYCVRRLIGIEVGVLFGLYWAPMSAAVILGVVAVGLDRAMATSVPLHLRLVLASLGAGVTYLGALRVLAPETFQEAGDLMLSALPRSLRDRIPGLGLGGGGQRR